MKHICLLVAALAAAQVHESRADGSAPGSSSPSEASPTTPARCIETSDVHGRRECRRFGRWGRGRVPALFVEGGATMRVFSSPLGIHTQRASHDGESFSYRVVAPPAESTDKATLATVRAGVIHHGFWFALEGEFGALHENTASTDMTSSGTQGSPRIDNGAVTIASGLGVVGGRYRLGMFALGAEGAAGFRTLTYRFESQLGASTDSSSVREVLPVLEARARADVWLSPYVSLGATYGRSVIDSGWLAGVHLNWNGRPFGY